MLQPDKMSAVLGLTADGRPYDGMQKTILRKPSMSVRLNKNPSLLHHFSMCRDLLYREAFIHICCCLQFEPRRPCTVLHFFKSLFVRTEPVPTVKQILVFQESKHKRTDRSVLCCLRKGESGQSWPRLTKEKAKVDLVLSTVLL